MRPNPLFEVDEEAFVAQLVRDNPWCVLVSTGADGGLVASHYPVMVDEEASELTLLTHVGRPDDALHGFGEREMMVIVQGRHGYISPSWYEAGPDSVPTWNFTVAHCYGVPEVLGEAENFAVLKRLTAYMERHVASPYELSPESGPVTARGTVGIRLPVTRFVAKRKLSQNRPPEVRERVIAALRRPGRYSDPELADEMETYFGGPDGGAQDSNSTTV